MNQGTARSWRLVAVLVGALLTPQVWAGNQVPPPGAWTKYENLAPVIGADGKSHSATCSALPGTDPRFSFWARTGSSKDLVVYFDGGGACWDNFTCSFPIVAGLPPQVPQLYVPAISPNTNPANYDGIFKLDNPANPVKDWSFVYIPYCTGDLHIGSAEKLYANAGDPVLNLPPTFTIQHRGFDNFMVVLDWIKKNFKAPKNVLVAGSSAGGYGASANFPWIQETFPQAHAYVIADASQGVTTEAFDEGNPGRNSWKPALAPWVFGNDPSLVPGPDLLRTAAEAYPHTKVSQFTTNFDGTQTLFYGLMKQFYGPGGSCPNLAVDWNQQMLRYPGFLYHGGRELPRLSRGRHLPHDPAQPRFLHRDLAWNHLQPLGSTPCCKIAAAPTARVEGIGRTSLARTASSLRRATDTSPCGQSGGSPPDGGFPPAPGGQRSPRTAVSPVRAYRLPRMSRPFSGCTGRAFIG